MQTRDIERHNKIGPLPAVLSAFLSRVEALPAIFDADRESRQAEHGEDRGCLPFDQLTVSVLNHLCDCSETESQSR